jgi:hypothetical protein
MLTVHHLSVSQSERIVWLCEELGLQYKLARYARDPKTGLAPPEYKALHPFGTAPVITDGNLVLGESGAIVDTSVGATQTVSSFSVPIIRTLPTFFFGFTSPTDRSSPAS